MPVVRVPTNFNIDVDFQIPEFYKRLLALFIDYLLLIIYASIANKLVNTAFPRFDTDDAWYNWRFSKIALVYGPCLLYFPLTEILLNGKTFGKKWLGIQIINEKGGKASISQLLIRWLLRDTWFIFLWFMREAYKYNEGETAEVAFLTIIVLVYFITEIILVVSSKKGQRIGDILAKTILVDIRQRSDISDTVFQEVADSYVPAFPEIMRLSDKDINAIKTILETARRKGDYQMAETAMQKITTYLKIETNMPAFDFLEVLLKDYNYLSVK